MKIKNEQVGDLTIAWIDPSERRPVYDHYAYVELSEEGLIFCYSYPNTNDQEDTYCGRAVRWMIDPDSSARHCNAIMREMIPYLARVHAGRKIVWNGSNYVGRYNADASEALDDIEYRQQRSGVWRLLGDEIAA